MYNPLYESVNVLVSDRNASTYGQEAQQILEVLEDVNSPVTAKYKERLYSEILEKAHIDFGDIPKSQGDITKYSGYGTMQKTLLAIKELAAEEHNRDVADYCNTVITAIDHLKSLSSTYQKGFATRTEYVALEYNVYVYTCVEAVTALLNNFVVYIRTPDAVQMPKIRNTKLRADAFYYDQLKKFNLVQDQMGIEYRQMLEQLCTKGQNNLVGTSTLIGIGTVSAVALAMIPITRELIYQIYNARVKIADAIDLQSKFLEMNAAALEHKDTMDATKRQKVSAKQSALAKSMHALAEKLRVKSRKSIEDTKREIKSANKALSIKSLEDDVSNANINDVLFI